MYKSNLRFLIRLEPNIAVVPPTSVFMIPIVDLPFVLRVTAGIDVQRYVCHVYQSRSFGNDRYTPCRATHAPARRRADRVIRRQSSLYTNSHHHIKKKTTRHKPYLYTSHYVLQYVAEQEGLKKKNA